MGFNAFALNHPISVAVFIILARPTYQQNEQGKKSTIDEFSATVLFSILYNSITY